MRRPVIVYLILLISISIVGCGGRSSSATDASSPGTDVVFADYMSIDGTLADGTILADQQTDVTPPPECAAPTTVASASDLVGHLDKLTWTYIGPYSSILLPVSDDFQVASQIALDAKDVAVPSTCLNRSDCRHQITFMFSDSPAVSCVEQEQVDFISGCAKLSLGAATVRFRASLQDTHPGQYNFMPIIEVLPECNAPCAQGQLRCEANHTCWSSFGVYCRLCLAKDKQDCACLTQTGPEPDEADCEFMVSGDVMCSGQCNDGTCEPTGTPGWAGCP